MIQILSKIKYYGGYFEINSHFPVTNVGPKCAEASKALHKFAKRFSAVKFKLYGTLLLKAYCSKLYPLTLI